MEMRALVATLRRSGGQIKIRLSQRKADAIFYIPEYLARPFHYYLLRPIVALSQTALYGIPDDACTSAESLLTMHEIEAAKCLRKRWRINTASIFAIQSKAKYTKIQQECSLDLRLKKNAV